MVEKVRSIPAGRELCLFARWRMRREIGRIRSQMDDCIGQRDVSELNQLLPELPFVITQLQSWFDNWRE